MSRTIHAVPVAAALVLALAAPNEADAQDSSSITTVWESLIGTTTENTESMGIGYAMSALGIAGPSDTHSSVKSATS